MVVEYLIEEKKFNIYYKEKNNYVGIQQKEKKIIYSFEKVRVEGNGYELKMNQRETIGIEKWLVFKILSIK